MSNSFEKKVSNNKKTNGKFKYITLSILLLVALLSSSYAIFTISLKGERKYSLTIGNLDFSLDNEQNAIRLMNAYPMSDIEGQALRPYTFTLTNTGTIKEYYKISLVTDAVSQASCDGCTFLSPSKLRYSLTVDSVVGEAKTVASETILETGELAVNQTKNYELRIWLNSSATIEEENKYYYGKIKVDASQEVVKETVTIGGISFPVEATTSTFPNFKQISSETNGRGIYKYQEDGEDIYYWRGAVTDNHIIFSGYCWEIVRTTSTGGLKIIYDGTPVEVDGVKTCPNTGTASQLTTKSAFNSSGESPAYVGYMHGNTVYEYKIKFSSNTDLTTSGILYGYDVEWTGEEYKLKAKDGGSLFSSTGSWSTDRTSVGNGNHYTCFDVDGKCETVSYVYYTGNAGASYYIDLSRGTTIEKAFEQMYSNEKSSIIKTTIETWFESTDLDKEENLKKLEDVVYCNDRSVTGDNHGLSKDGDASEKMYYSSYTRVSNGTPDLSCSGAENNRDRFTYKDVTNGNGLLKWPVGLLTADEIMLTGGQTSSNSNYYLYTGENYWTLSPFLFFSNSIQGFYVHYYGTLNSTNISNTNGIRPVVSLATGIEITGLGTEDNPFEVK